MQEAHKLKTVSLTAETIKILKDLARFLGTNESSALRYMILKTARESGLLKSIA